MMGNFTTMKSLALMFTKVILDWSGQKRSPTGANDVWVVNVKQEKILFRFIHPTCSLHARMLQLDVLEVEPHGRILDDEDFDILDPISRYVCSLCIPLLMGKGPSRNQLSQ